MGRHNGMTSAERAFVEGQGGVIRDTHDGYAVDFPEQTQADAKAIEAAVARAVEWGTRCMPLWRPRGAGWYVAESREEHPGCWYLLQLDEQTGIPLSCECEAATVCHHQGAAISVWRERVDWAKNDADTMALWQETLDRIRANTPREVEELWT